MAVLHNLLVRRADCRLTRCDTAVYLRLHLNYVALQLHEKKKKNLEHLSWSTLISISSGTPPRRFLSTLPKLNSASVSSYRHVKLFEVKGMVPSFRILRPLAIDI